jgi:hypothetical protein
LLVDDIRGMVPHSPRQAQYKVYYNSYYTAIEALPLVLVIRAGEMLGESIDQHRFYAALAPEGTLRPVVGAPALCQAVFRRDVRLRETAVGLGRDQPRT